MKNTENIFPLVQLANEDLAPVLLKDPGQALEAGQYAIANVERFRNPDKEASESLTKFANGSWISHSNAMRHALHVGLANEERFTAAYYSEPLTQYAVGWTDGENLQLLTDCIAPRVAVGRRFEFKAAKNSESFLSEGDDLRAIGANFKRIEYTGSSINAKTDNRGLVYRLDLDEEGAGILTEELIVARILQRLRRNKYRRAITALTGAVTANTNKTWSSGAATPTEDVGDAMLLALKDAGILPNRMLVDFQAWRFRQRGLATQLTAGSIADYRNTAQEWGQLIGVDQTCLSKAVYQTSATAKTLISNAKVFIFLGQDAPSRDDPTNVKNFVTPVGDGDFRVFRQPMGSKFVDISVEYYDNISATATVGAQSLTIS